jgi:hypothetical protein
MAQTSNPVLTTWAFRKRNVKEVQGGTSVTDVYVVPAGQTAAFEAAFPRNLAHPTYTSSLCVEYDIEPEGGEGDQLYVYTLSYEPLSIAFKNGRPPKLAASPDSSDPLSVIWEWEGIQIDKPLESHPSYDSGWQTEGDPDYKPGVDSYIEGGAIYRKTVAVQLDYVFNTAELTKDVGKRQSPENLSGALAAAKYWLRLPNKCRSAGGHLEFIAEWRFAPDEVDSDLYQDA